MRIVDRIIRHTVMTSTFLVSCVILGLQSFLSLIQQFQFVGHNHYTLLQVFKVVPMELPAQFYQLFPMAGFLGALIGLSRLSSTSQLIVMRASGVSIARIAWSVVKAAIVMILIATILGEGFGPVWQQKAEQMRFDALNKRSSLGLLDSIWLHEGNNFTHIAELKDQHTMLDITRYRFASDGHLERATIANRGRLVQGRWMLFDLKHTLFLGDHVTTQTQQQAGLHVLFQPLLQMQMHVASEEQTLTNLYKTIRYRQSIGLGVNRFIFSFWQRVLQPVTSLVMICLAVPFVFGSFRSASMGLRIIAGVLIGFIFYMLNQLFGPITLVYQFPPLLAAIIPTGVFLGVMIILLSRVR